MAVRNDRHRIGPAPESTGAGPTVVLIDHAGRVSSQRGPRLLDRALASSRGFSLDERLAAGASPEADRLIALRAQSLVRPARRQRLASDWGRLLKTARERPGPGRRVPLRRERIVAAETDIRELQQSLRVALPVPARGVAMASRLLTDGTGPVYSRRSRADLHGALRETIRQLDPSAALQSDPFG